MLRRAIGHTDKGRVRPKNEDAYDIGKFEDGTVWAVVCDGMGGANGGNVASMMAVDTIAKAFSKSYREDADENSIRSMLLTALNAANTYIYEAAKEDEELSGMGTTVVAVVVKEDTAYIAHVGDSRAYLIRNDSIEQETKDHSMVQLLVERGELTEEEAMTHPKKNYITRAVGVEEELDVDYNEIPLLDTDTILLCTDGLTNCVSKEEILSIIQEQGALASPDVLVERAIEHGGSDNITVVVISQ